METESKKMPLLLELKDLSNIGQYMLAEGYNIRNFKKGEEVLWAQVLTAAGEFDSVEAALLRFKEEFGRHIAEMEKRCFFLLDGSGAVIGTVTAWYNRNYRGEDYGRIHWVAIHPDYQGRKLGRPLLAMALSFLAKHHKQAYLKTSNKNIKAIGLYSQFGFQLVSEQD